VFQRELIWLRSASGEWVPVPATLDNGERCYVAVCGHVQPHAAHLGQRRMITNARESERAACLPGTLCTAQTMWRGWASQ
jgi:hypothetical protein